MFTWVCQMNIGYFNIIVEIVWISTSFRLRFLVDFIILVLPMTMCFTVFSGHITEILTGMFFISLCITISIVYCYYPQECSFSSLLELQMPERRAFVTNYRAYVNISTAISIGAVVFVVYPHRFAKSLIYGTGLMDVGVGAFVICNAMVSKEARQKCASTK